jgi:hypothetical protein
MKRRLLVVSAIACTLVALTLFTQKAWADDPEGTFDDARVVYDVTVDGQKGMRVHARFTVREGLKVPCQLVAYFCNSDGSPVKANDKRYANVEGAVSASTNFTPAYDPAEYKDLPVFIPYSALNLARGGQYDLKFYLALYDKSAKRFFRRSGFFKFIVTMPGA